MHPILFYVKGNFYIGTYGALVAIGILAAIFFAAWRARKQAVPEGKIFDLCFYIVLSGIIGGRVFYILANFGDFIDHPLDYIFSRTGFVFYGGVLFGLIGGTLYIRKQQLKLWPLADIIAPAIPLGHFFGRLGCFSAGCCFGKPTSGILSFLGVAFPRVVDKEGNVIGSFVYIDHVSQGLISAASPRSLPVYPTQLFEAGANLFILGLLLVMERRQKFSGQLFLSYLVLYSVMRLVIEFFRGDERGSLFGIISTSQFVAIIVIIGAIIFWRHRKKMVSKES